MKDKILRQLEIKGVLEVDKRCELVLIMRVEPINDWLGNAEVDVNAGDNFAGDAVFFRQIIAIIGICRSAKVLLDERLIIDIHCRWHA